MSFLRTYAEWLHLRFPGGDVESLPKLTEGYRSSMKGVYVVGDLAGIPLLKYSLDSGARAVDQIAEERVGGDGTLDLLIVGAGAAGISAAKRARERGLSFEVLDARRKFATIHDFQERKPIYTYPKEMTPAGPLTVEGATKEALLDHLEGEAEDVPVRRARVTHLSRSDGLIRAHVDGGDDLTARSVIVAIGRSGDYRSLDIPGEELGHVHHRLHDPAAYAGERVVVIGGGDAACEAAIALAEAGAEVVMSYRRSALGRPKEENIQTVQRLADRGRVELLFESEAERIEHDRVVLETPAGLAERRADTVFAMIGREPPVDFFQRSGIELKNDWADAPAFWESVRARSSEAVRHVNWRRVAALTAFVTFMACVFSLTKGGWIGQAVQSAGWFPYSLEEAARVARARSLWQVTLVSATQPAFYYTLVYSVIVVLFGWRRVRRRKTPYVYWQTATLALIQVLPLFILPEIVLPYLGANGLLPGGLLDALFPSSEWAVHGREYWRAYGFILAWPLLVYNVFTAEPLFWWLVICFVQTFVLIPGLVYIWGKGAYCGWICSCGALAETLGDAHREKMPHGPKWNALNMAGQVILAIAFLLLFARIGAWIWPGSWFGSAFDGIMYGELFGANLNYAWTVDVVLAGVIGYGVFFWLSGRFWCRFFCPLAALMHIYARFSRFRILAEKEKCISCNVCTSVCHQGIDVMHYAQRGAPMDDPQCVRCSACVQSCPTGVLSFGQVDPKTEVVVSRDDLVASLVRAREGES